MPVTKIVKIDIPDEISKRAAAALLFPIYKNWTGAHDTFDALAKRALRHGDGDNLITSKETEHEITPA